MFACIYSELILNTEQHIYIFMLARVNVYAVRVWSCVCECISMLVRMHEYCACMYGCLCVCRLVLVPSSAGCRRSVGDQHTSRYYRRRLLATNTIFPSLPPTHTPLLFPASLSLPFILFSMISSSVFHSYFFFLLLFLPNLDIRC